MPTRPGKQLTDALQSLLAELWRLADRGGCQITAHGDDVILAGQDAVDVILTKPPIVRPPAVRLPRKAT